MMGRACNSYTPKLAIWAVSFLDSLAASRKHSCGDIPGRKRSTETWGRDSRSALGSEAVQTGRCSRLMPLGKNLR